MSHEANRRVSYIAAHQEELARLIVKSFDVSEGDVSVQAAYLRDYGLEHNIPIRELEAATLMANDRVRTFVVGAFIKKHKGRHIDTDMYDAVERQLRLALRNAR